MIISRGAKEMLSNVTGIHVVSETEEDHNKRIKNINGPKIRRYELASAAAGDYAIRGAPGPARDSVMQFLKDCADDLNNLQTNTVSKRRWLEISGLRIPLPSPR